MADVTVAKVAMAETAMAEAVMAETAMAEAAMAEAVSTEVVTADAVTPRAWLTLDRVSFDGRGHRVLDAISLRLSARRTFILGPNGAGKSVLLRVMHGLLAPSAGEVRWERLAGSTPPGMAARAANSGVPNLAPGQPAAGAPPRPRLAMVFQRPVMLRRSALDNVIYGMHAKGSGAGVTARAQEKLARVGLAHLAARPARVLSGGEQQRVALARAWALQPDVLLLDEPTANLDPHAIRQVEAIIGEIAAGGTAIVMTTHHRGLARRLADEVIFLHQGRVAEHTPAARFFDQPLSQPGRDYLRGDLE